MAYHIKIIEHIVLSMSALGLACLVALPLGILISSRKRLTQLVVSVASLLQTIPSLALLAMIVPIMGVGKKPAIFALFLYALMPILRNTVLGMESVDKDLIDAAKGMGFTYFQVIQKVQFPLAFSVVMSGIRQSGIYILAWTSLASYIGAGGLGDLIFSGMNNYNINLILLGTLPILVLGLVVDYGLGALQKKLSIMWGVL